MLQKTIESNKAPSLVGSYSVADAPSPNSVFSQYMGFMRRQLAVILFAVVLALGLGAVYVFGTPPSYTAQARLIIDARKGQVLQQQSIIGDLPVDSVTVESQVEILKSETVALAVIRNLRLNEEAEFIGGGAGLIGSVIGAVSNLFTTSEPESTFELTRRALRSFESRLNVKRVGLTYVIEISFRSLDRERSAIIANAVADAYIVDQLEAKYQATRRASVWLQDRIRELREQASAADRAVVNFKTKNNIVDANGKLMNEQQLAELNSQLVLARAHTSDTKARLDRIEQIVNAEVPDASTVADTLKSDVVSKLRSQYLDLAAREADWSARYGRDHLAAVDLRNRMREIRRSIVDELRRLAETYKSDYQIAKQREEGLTKELQLAVSQSQVTNQAQVQLRELESAAQSYRTLYDNFLQRYMESVQQQSFPITEARLISKAAAPLGKSHPQTMLILAIAGFGGLMIGFGVGAWRELSDRVLRTSDQVEALLGTDCIAVVPRLKRGVVPLLKGSAAANVTDADDDPTSAESRNTVRAQGIMRTAVDSPFSRFTEEIRSIKLAADLKGVAKSNKVIGFTSSLPDEGKSTLATALAQLIAGTGAQVILVDCDLRNPSLTRTLSPKAAYGMIDVLAGEMTLEHAVLNDPTTGIDFLPAVVKSRLAHSNEVLASDATRKLFDELRRRYDYVIADFSPLAPVVDVRATAHLVDSFVFVVEWGRTPIDVVEKVLNSAPTVYENLLGAVLNKADVAMLGRYETYGGSYYYNKQYHRYGYTE